MPSVFQSHISRLVSSGVARSASALSVSQFMEAAGFSETFALHPIRQSNLRCQSCQQLNLTLVATRIVVAGQQLSFMGSQVFSATRCLLPSTTNDGMHLYQRTRPHIPGP